MFNLEVIMTTDLITISSDSNLDEARGLMKEHRIRHLPVLDGQETLVGLLTSTDVLAATDSMLRSAREKIPASEIMVSEVMVQEIVTVSPNAGLRQAALFLEKHKIGCLPVVADGKLLGIITDTDFVGVAINLLEQIEETEPVERD